MIQTTSSLHSSFNASRVPLAMLCCALFGGATLLAGCSDSSTGGTSGSLSDAGTGNDSGGDSGGGADSGDAGAKVINECTAFLDRSGANAARTLAWDFAIAQSTERCLTIKKGQEVVFEGDFTLHPLEDEGGDTPNPFASVTPASGKATVAFAATGTFGFICGQHPAMTGAVKVIE